MNLRAAQEPFWERWASLRHLVHTTLVRHRFAHWGERSRIERSSKLMSPFLVTVGDDVHVCEHAWLNAKDTRGDGAPTLRIGDRSYIGRFVHINAWQSVTIDEDVLVADRVFISDSGHQFADRTLPVARQPDPFLGPVHLKAGCWIGTGAVILPGVTVGRNAVVAANAVVTGDVPDHAVVGGVPARALEPRKKAR
jgi:acetyltransferase-like isoleucine patch superfamily enzyme